MPEHQEYVGDAFALHDVQGVCGIEVVQHHIAATAEPDRHVRWLTMFTLRHGANRPPVRGGRVAFCLM